MSELRAKVERYYSGRFAEHGANARGVDWNGAESQELRFAKLLEIVQGPGRFSLNDYGCGYGALVGFLERSGLDAEYTGFDLAPAMLDHGLASYPGTRFVSSEDELNLADYTVASGIFNVRLDVPADTWTEYVLETVDRLAALSRRGFAFNMLTSYSDKDRLRDDLYYGDPAFYFDHCKRRYARNVALLHDYGLYEFTLLVRKELG
jgi:SAM-dependent methyltransferase